MKARKTCCIHLISIEVRVTRKGKLPSGRCLNITVFESRFKSAESINYLETDPIKRGKMVLSRDLAN